MQRSLYVLILFVLAAFFPFSRSEACGHEGAYVGLGYTQFIAYSPDHQLVSSTGTGSAATTGSRIELGTRPGAHFKIGYDFCGSRWGFEIPVMVSMQRLNRAETIYVGGVDANAIFHIIETETGVDFFWIGGLGATILTEGTLGNNTASGGINANFGPGFQYFFARGNHRSAIQIALPVRVAILMGDNLSNRSTRIVGIPIQISFTFAF